MNVPSRLKAMGFIKYFRAHPFVALALFAVVAGIFFWYVSRGREPINETVAVSKTDVVQEVSITGKVKPVQTVDLSFEKSGKIGQIYAAIGDKVVSGKALLALQNGDLAASLSQARAQLKIDEAKLAELVKGARTEDIEVKQSELDKAKQDLENYYNDVTNTLNDAYIKADDAARIKTSGIFSGYKTTAYKLTYTSCSGESGSDAEWLRFKSETELDKWEAELNLLSDNSPRSELENALKSAKAHLDVVENLLQKISETLITGCTGNDATLNTYRSNTSTARTNVVAAQTDVIALEQNIAAQKVTVVKIENELKLKLAGNTVEQINAQKAQVEYALARVEGAEAEFAKTIIRAPFSGTVTKQGGKLGETTSENSPIVSMISESQFEIEAFMPEADITKVRVGDLARVTLDAYGSDVFFSASIAVIYPAETVIEGVPTYKVLFKFAEDSEQIKSGMTANIDIETGKKSDVIAVPQRSVINKNGQNMVRLLLQDGTIVETPVTIGLRGSSGEVEVVSGLKEGDKVIIF